MKPSIIIPAYNEEACLPATLDSIQTTSAQLGTGVDFEIIVVDNASDDETASVAREKGARLVHDPVRGISKLRSPQRRWRRACIHRR